MKRRPTPRADIYDLYWQFAAERQAMFYRRVEAHSPPWTVDPILATFKFCNVYRAADRVSQFLIRTIAYGNYEVSPADRLFQLIAFRLFSKIETWLGIVEELGQPPTIATLESGTFEAALDRVKEALGVLYTGAFILCAADSYSRGIKHHNHVELLRDMFVRHRLGDRLLQARSLEHVFALLREFPLIGDFMAYQIAIDLNYSVHIDFGENDFTKPGPGAIRGIRKAFESLGDFTADEVILWMVERQEEEFRARDLEFRGLWGRPLHAIDCQGLFCELDKYCRVARPDLASSRKRIKSRFAASGDGIVLFFPPKWGLNESLPREKVLGLGEHPVDAGQRMLFTPRAEV